MVLEEVRRGFLNFAMEWRWEGVKAPDVCEGGGEVCCECPAKERCFAE